MSHKLLLAALVATGTLGGLALTPGTASAQPSVASHGRRYAVLVRHGRHWQVAGTYHSRRDAEREVEHLRHRRFDARIDVC